MKGTNNAENPATYTIETASITLQIPNRDYYTFSGWYDNVEFTGPAILSIAKGSIGAKALWAKWTPINYAIAYVLYGGANHGDNPTTYTVESSTITLKDPTKDGFLLCGMV